MLKVGKFRNKRVKSLMCVWSPILLRLFPCPKTSFQKIKWPWRRVFRANPQQILLLGTVITLLFHRFQPVSSKVSLLDCACLLKFAFTQGPQQLLQIRQVTSHYLRILLRKLLEYYFKKVLKKESLSSISNLPSLFNLIFVLTTS